MKIQFFTKSIHNYTYSRHQTVVVFRLSYSYYLVYHKIFSSSEMSGNLIRTRKKSVLLNYVSIIFSRSKLYISDFSNFFVDKKNNKKQLQKIISLPTYKGKYLVEMPPLPKKKKRKEIMHSLPCARVFFCGQKLMVSATN